MFHFLGGVLFPPQNGQVQVGWWIKGLKTSLKSRGFNDIQWSVAICRCVHACFGSCCGVDVVWFSPNHVGSVCWKLTKPRTDSPWKCQNILNFLFPLLFFTNQIPSCFSSTFYLKAQPPQQKESYINLTWAETPIFSALWQALFNSGKVTEPLRSLSKAWRISWRMEI